jgi:hypothetical protein
VRGEPPQVGVLLDSGREVSFSEKDHDALRLAYAQHAYSSQGRTVDNVYALAGGWSTDRESGYVSVSRAREQSHVYADADTLGVDKEQQVGGEAVEVPWETRRRHAVEELGRRYEESRPQVAALSLLNVEREGKGEEPAREGRGDKELISSGRPTERQLEYLEALGGDRSRPQTWPEASVAIDQQRGDEEGRTAISVLSRQMPEREANEIVSQARERLSQRDEATSGQREAGELGERMRQEEQSRALSRAIDPREAERERGRGE